MNSALVHLTRGRSVIRIAIVILGIAILSIALATAAEALAWGGGRCQRRSRRRRISP